MLCCRRRNTALVAELPRLRRWVLGKHTLLTTIPTHNTCATKWENAHTTAHTTTVVCDAADADLSKHSRFHHTLFDRNRGERCAKGEHEHGTALHRTGRKAMYYRYSTATF